MKLLFFSPYFYPYTSGLTTYPLKILDFLSKENQITVLTFPHKKKLLKHEKIGRLDIVRLPYWFKISKGFISPQSIYYFIHKAWKNDLIILNLPNFEGLFLAFIGKLLGKKIISIFHCSVYLGDDFISRIISFILNVSVFVQFLLSNTVVGYTDDYINNLWLGKIFRKKIQTVLPPVEKLFADRAKLNEFIKEKNNSLWIGFAGRLAKEKGIEYLIEATSQLKTKFPKVKLVFAGPYGKDVAGEDDYYKKIVRLLNEKRITYCFLGNLKNGELGSFYKAIDILVLPSINKTEAFGMVQVEAMLLGTPVIASNLPGVRAPIKLTKMGLIVDPKNSSQLNKTIEEIINDKHKFINDKLTKNCEKIFDINKTYHFYKKLVTGRLSHRANSNRGG